ncbi:MAG: hypothetical protein ACE5FL_11660 [Myxococcota bacterium]
MADLPGRQTRRLIAAVAALATVAAAAAPATEPAVDLIGSWHVLVHYTDDHTQDPTQLRWDDRVWVFERSGSRLRWIEYPIVIFQDDTGRFEPRGGMRAARVLHAWEPNAGQRAQIEAGLEVNNRGQKSKTLRAHGEHGWRSANRPTASSASVVSYVENWSIEGLDDKPVFRREDVLGSGLMDSLDGVTQYTTTEVAPGGDELRGAFQRDASRRGTFRLTRAGTSKSLEGGSPSVGQRFRKQFLGSFRDALKQREKALHDLSDEGADGQISAEARERARAMIRAALLESIRAARGDPELLAPEIESLSRLIERRMLDAGADAHEIDQMLKDGRLNP